MPDWTGQALETAVGLHGVREDVFERLGPLDTVIETVETPELL